MKHESVTRRVSTDAACEVATSGSRGERDMISRNRVLERALPMCMTSPRGASKDDGGGVGPSFRFYLSYLRNMDNKI